MFSLSPSDWIAASSSVVALCALGATIWQAYLTRRHNVLSVRPHIEIVQTFRSGNTEAISLKNRGLGPAFVDWVEVRSPDRKIRLISEADYDALCELIFEREDDVAVTYYYPDAHTAIAAGESLTLLYAESQDPELVGARLERVFGEDQLLVHVSYRCLYGQTYQSDQRPPVTSSEA